MLFTAPVSVRQRIAILEDDKLSQQKLLQLTRSTIPAVTHVNYSARLQTVSDTHTAFYQLLKAFHQLTGCPLLINTSFNMMEEPIVCSPHDAISGF